MVTVKIRNNSKQAKVLLEYMKTFSFVEFVENKTEKTKILKRNSLLKDIETGLNEVKSIREGKQKPLTTSALWDNK